MLKTSTEKRLGSPHALTPHAFGTILANMCAVLGIHNLDALCKKELRYADIGCSDGDLSSSCSSRLNMSGTAVDHNPQCIKQLKRRRQAASDIVKQHSQPPSATVARGKGATGFIVHQPYPVHRVEVLEADLTGAYVDLPQVDVVFNLTAGLDDTILGALLHLVNPMYLARRVLVYVELHEPIHTQKFLRDVLGISKNVVFGPEPFQHEGNGSVRQVIGFLMQEADFTALGAAVWRQHQGITAWVADGQVNFNHGDEWRLPAGSPDWLLPAAEAAAKRLYPEAPTSSVPAAATAPSKGIRSSNRKRPKRELPQQEAEEASVVSKGGKPRGKAGPAVSAVEESDQTTAKRLKAAVAKAVNEKEREMRQKLKDEQAKLTREQEKIKKQQQQIEDEKQRVEEEKKRMKDEGQKRKHALKDQHTAEHPQASPPAGSFKKRAKTSSTPSLTTPASDEEVASPPEAARGRAVQLQQQAATSDARLAMDRIVRALKKGTLTQDGWISLTKMINPKRAEEALSSCKLDRDRRTVMAMVEIKGISEDMEMAASEDVEMAASEDVEMDRVKRFSQYGLDVLELLDNCEGGELYTVDGDAAYVKARIKEIKGQQAQLSTAMEEWEKKTKEMTLPQLQMALQMKLKKEEWANDMMRSRISELEAEAEHIPSGLESLPPALENAFMQVPRAAQQTCGFVSPTPSYGTAATRSNPGLRAPVNVSRDGIYMISYLLH